MSKRIVAEPHLRLLQKRLAEEVTVMAHSREDYDAAVEASRDTVWQREPRNSCSAWMKAPFLQFSRECRCLTSALKSWRQGVTISDLCAVHTTIAESKGELRRLIQGGGVSLNKGEGRQCRYDGHGRPSAQPAIPAGSEGQERVIFSSGLCKPNTGHDEEKHKG
ncbi:MAG: hypothetical protein MZV63_67035 [Marinilabiliales bacterium]|nr:hypothetical protein [Marinilabiliales bacterium]